MSARAERFARVRAIVDRRHGDKISVSPMASAGQYGSKSGDPTREPFDVVGKVLVGAGDQVGFSDRSNTQIPSGKAEAYVDDAAWPKASTIKQGDELVAEEHHGLTFEVERLDRREHGRVVFRLNVRGSCP